MYPAAELHTIPTLKRRAAPCEPRLTALAADAGPTTRGTLVIVGNGMVSHRLCQRLAERGAMERYRVVVFGEEVLPAYDRVHLTDMLAGRDHTSLLIAPVDWYEARGIELRLGDPVIEIDRDAQVVTSRSGAHLRYDRVVLATGSSPLVPRVEGIALPGVFVYRTIQDLRAIQTYAAGARRAAVIGGGLLGLEAARALRHLGLEISIVELAAALMAAQLDKEGAAALEARIAALGIRARTGTITTRIEVEGTARRLHFADGGTLTVDMVVIAAGIRPRSELAVSCGLDRGAAGAVAVDDTLTTSDPRIFAIGECAAHQSRHYGLVAPGYEMADVLATNLTGGHAAFTGSEPATRLKLLGVDVATAGDPLDAGSASRCARDGTYRLIRVDRGRLVGAIGVGAWPEFSRIQASIAARRRVWPWQVARFERTGHLWPAPPETPVMDWPAAAIVCNCLGVTRGQLAAACDAGCAAAALGARTGAGTLCGSCAPLLAEIAGGKVSGPRTHVRRILLGVSLAALLAVLAVLAANPVPYADSVDGGWRFDELWRDGLYRQISGYLLVSLCACAGLLTARKRWARAWLGSFGAWRTMHAVIGVLAVAALATHTGLRLGHQLNFALTTAFLILNLAGIAAGAVTAVEGRLPARSGRRWRAALVLAHIVGVWPLPVLVLFHVLAVYYF